MKFIVRTGPGTVGVNFMYLPTFIGINSSLIREIEEQITPELLGKPLTEESLEEASQAAIDFLANKFPGVAGLRDYLDGLKFVEENGGTQTNEANEEGRAASS